MSVFDRFKVTDDSEGSDHGKMGRIPEGEYKVTILEQDVDEERERVSFRLHFATLGGEKGITRWKGHSVKSEKAYNFLARELRKLGFTITSNEEMKAAIFSTPGIIATVQVKNQPRSDEYQDFYFVRAEGRDRQLTDLSEVMGGAGASSNDHDDDLPF